MKPIKIRTIRQTVYDDLIEEYENPLPEPCPLRLHQSWTSKEAKCPENFCESAWHDLYPYVFALAQGARNLYDGWMKDPQKALISCNDGFRPMSFLIEVVEEEK